ncbi:MAG TPA: hypothetical protein VLS90_15790 [Thermodesulfobacteriota bacterium]|nr:hypothetical protein [Thermodesulfobacteriota bacterium]
MPITLLVDLRASDVASDDHDLAPLRCGEKAAALGNGLHDIDRVFVEDDAGLGDLAEDIVFLLLDIRNVNDVPVFQRDILAHVPEVQEPLEVHGDDLLVPGHVGHVHVRSLPLHALGNGERVHKRVVHLEPVTVRSPHFPQDLHLFQRPGDDHAVTRLQENVLGQIPIHEQGLHIDRNDRIPPGDVGGAEVGVRPEVNFRKGFHQRAPGLHKNIGHDGPPAVMGISAPVGRDDEDPLAVHLFGVDRDLGLGEET